MKYLACFLFAGTMLNCPAQNAKSINSTEFVLDCMKSNGEIPDKQMVLWLPYEFWQLIGDEMKISSDAKSEIVSEMKKYMLFAVVDYKIAVTGTTFKSETEIRKDLILSDSSGKTYRPMDLSDLSPGAKRIIMNLTPIMAGMLSEFGEGMQLFMFDGREFSIDNRVSVDVHNNFSLRWNSNVINWTLPFASVLPAKYCPINNESMKGNWLFCPIHGVKLKD